MYLNESGAFEYREGILDVLPGRIEKGVPLMFGKKIIRCSIFGILLMTAGCGWLRDRTCSSSGTLMSRFRGSSGGYPIETGISGGAGDCGCTNGSTAGPMLGTPIYPSGPTTILPNPAPIPQIKEKSGQEKEYIPGMMKGAKPPVDFRTSKDGI